jgi:hypothetical protein
MSVPLQGGSQGILAERMHVNMIYFILATTFLLVFGLMGIAAYLIYLEYREVDLIKTLTARLQSERVRYIEKRSRKRVDAIIHSNQTPIQKCVALDKELSKILGCVTINQQWKNIVESLFKDTMNKNNLTMRSNGHGGTYIVNEKEGEFSKCLMVY